MTAFSKTANRPGLSSLNYRAGTYTDFLFRLRESLSTQAIHGKAEKAAFPLADLTTSEPDDPAMALLDVWAMAADVLTFYQERIANEGFLRTAQERRSILELVRSLGYELSPGVSAATHLSFVVDETRATGDSVEVPRGTQIMSVPKKRSLPQIFETSHDLQARAEWNRLRPRTRGSQKMGQGIDHLYIQGLDSGLKPGDVILLVGDERKTDVGSERWDLRTLRTVIPLREEALTQIGWELGLGHDKPYVIPALNPKLFVFRHQALLFGRQAPDWKEVSENVRRQAAGSNPPKIVGSVFHQDIERWIHSASSDGVVRQWDIESGLLEERVGRASEPAGLFGFSANRRFVLMAQDSGRLVRKSLATGRTLNSFPMPEDRPQCLALSENGRWAVTGDGKGQVRFWNARARQPLMVGSFSVHDGAVTCVGFSPNQEWAASGGQDKTVAVWDLGSASRPSPGSQPAVQFSPAHNQAVTSMVFHPTGDFLATGGADGRIQIWDLNTGQIIRIFQKHSDAVLTLAFSQDGNILVSGSRDRTAKLWDTQALTAYSISLIQNNADPQEGAVVADFVGHLGSVRAATLSKDGLLLVTGSEDGTLKIWEAQTGRQIRNIEAHSTLDTHKDWPGFSLQNQRIDLDTVHPKILDDQWVALVKPTYTELYKTTNASTVKRKDFGLDKEVTRLELDTDEHLNYFGLRDSVLLCDSEPLTLAVVDLQDPIHGAEVKLDRFVPGLQTDKILIFAGKRMRCRVTELSPAMKKSKDSEDSEETEESDDSEKSAESAESKENNGSDKPKKCIKVEFKLRGEDGSLGEPIQKGDEFQIVRPASGQGLDDWRLRDREGFVGTISKVLSDREENIESVSEVIVEMLSVSASLSSSSLEVEVRMQEIPSRESDELVSEVVVVDNVVNSEEMTTLTFRKPLDGYYDVGSVLLHANVASANHGESTQEVLGSGDGSLANQTFVLKKPPLTHVSAPTAHGYESTLEIRVNDVLWHQVSSLYGEGPEARVYIVRLDDEARPVVIFGDGKEGSRLSTGQENIRAIYRSGIGTDGELGSESLIMLKTRPLGIQSVMHPLPSIGSAPPQERDQARENAPLSVQTMGRIVSLKDYENFARNFAGIAKARAVLLIRGETRLCHLTVAGTNGGLVPETSDLHHSLVQAIRSLADPTQEFRVQGFQPRLFIIDARVQVGADFLSAKVLEQAKAALRQAFSFDRRSFGQPVTASEVISAIHEVEGVVAVDLEMLEFKEPPLVKKTGDVYPVLEPQDARWEGQSLRPAEIILLDPLVSGVKLEPMGL